MENIFEWLRYHKKLDLLLFFLFFIVIPIAPFIQSPIGILSKDDAIIFLSYYGTVIAGLAGGALTLFGVWWTIKDQEQKRKADLVRLYKPIIKLEFENFIYNNGGFTANYKLVNKGRGEALNFKTEFIPEDSKFTIIPILQPSDLVEVDGYIELSLNMYYKVSENIMEESFISCFDVEQTYCAVMKIKYNDIFDTKYELNTKIELHKVCIPVINSDHIVEKFDTSRFGITLSNLKYL